ncbi:MAG: MFS transporter [Hyphomicrobiaceae bacterium]
MSIETRGSWLVAIVALTLLFVAFGSIYIVVVALKQMASEYGNQRAIPALAYSLAWFGGAVGGLGMGPLAERIGVQWTVIFGATMAAAGLALSSQGEVWQLYLGHGVLIGVLGNAGINAPLLIYATRWFDRRRGMALGLISSGQYLAGAVWPAVFERVIAEIGWRQTMLYYGLLEVAIIIPLALIFLSAAPPDSAAQSHPAGSPQVSPMDGLGLRPNALFAMLAIANFLCCVPMAMPNAHLIALCGDLGLSARTGAAMLSLLLVCAIISRQFWGWMADRVGGLMTLLTCSLAQALAIAAFSLTQDEAGLFFVAAAFGLGFSGLIPTYVFTIREFFPANEASWRVPVQLLLGGSGMAFGGWFAGYIYDHMAFYAPAFAIGFLFNVANTAILTFLVYRQNRFRRRARLVAAE